MVGLFTDIGFGRALIQRKRVQPIEYYFVYVLLNYMIKTTSYKYCLEQIMPIVRKKFENKVKN